MEKTPRRVKVYADKVLATQAAHLIAYWPLWEATGAVADNYEGTAARDGAYTDVTLGQTGIGDGHTCPLFDGAAGFVNIYTTSLRDALDGAEGSFALWAKVYDAGVWTDSTTRHFLRLRADAQNRMSFTKQSADNRVDWIYEAGNVVESNTILTLSLTTWMHIAMTWSVVADQVIYYLNGVQDGAIDTGLGTWVGLLASDNTVVGASDTVPNTPWHGYIAHVALWDTPLTSTEMAALAVV